MELRQLRYFRAVVEAGSFTAAAEALHMSQPPLSLSIAKLEIELGVTLLVRSARGVQPTSAGSYLMDAGSRVVSELDDIVERISRFGAGAEGLLTLAAVPVLMWNRIPGLLRQHAEQFPDVDIRLLDPPPWVAIDMVVDRTVDAAFIVVADPAAFAERYRGVLSVLHWSAAPLVGVFPPEQADLPETVPLSVFDGEVFVLPRRTFAVPSLPDIVEKALADHHITPSQVRTVETIQTSIPLIEAGLARSIFPNPGGHSLDGFSVVVRRIEQPIPALHAVVVVRAGVEPEPALARLLERVHGGAE